MLLTAYKIDDIPVNELEQYETSDLNGNLAFKTESSVSTGYQDISSIENWFNADILDWSRRRDNIVPLFYAIASSNLSTYGNLSAAQKLIGAKLFLVPYSLRVTNGTVTEEEDKENWSTLLRYTKESRITCVESMRIKTGQYIRVGTLTLAQTQSFYKDAALLTKWFEEANVPDFKLWLTNEVGSAYENDGFAQKSYYNESLKTDLLAIYNGAY